MRNWTAQEDQILQRFYDQTQTFKKWKKISDKFSSMGIQKSVYECRQRYVNKLDPTVTNADWTKEQTRDLFLFYNEHGSRWQKIQTLISKRTQTQLKNKFYSILRSFLLKALQKQNSSKNSRIGNIDSKTIKRMYEATDQFQFMKGSLFTFLEICDFQINTNKILIVIRKYESIFQKLKQFYSKKMEANSNEKKYKGKENQKQDSKQQIKKSQNQSIIDPIISQSIMSQRQENYQRRITERQSIQQAEPIQLPLNNFLAEKYQQMQSYFNPQNAHQVHHSIPYDAIYYNNYETQNLNWRPYQPPSFFMYYPQ